MSSAVEAAASAQTARREGEAPRRATAENSRPAPQLVAAVEDRVFGGRAYIKGRD